MPRGRRVAKIALVRVLSLLKKFMEIAGRIESRRNARVSDAAALRERRERTQRGCFLLEGAKLLREARARGVVLTEVFATERALPVAWQILIGEENEDAGRSSRLVGRGNSRETSGAIRDGASDLSGDEWIIAGGEPEVYVVTEAVFDRLTSEKSPEGIAAVARTPRSWRYSNAPQLPPSPPPLLLASLQDPGNVGTILRSAAALGVREVLLSPDTADIGGARALRASMGAAFSLALTTLRDLSAAMDSLRANGVPVLAATLSPGATPLPRLPRETLSRAALVIGSEAAGVPPDLLPHTSGSVIIPMRGRVESLNAAAAAAILLYEAQRAREGE